jgi:hypothetical protein
MRNAVRNRRLPVLLGVLAVLLGMAPGNGSGGSSSCTPGVSTQVTAASTPGQPVRVTTNASVVCPTPEAPGGQIWGPHNPQPQQPHVAGTKCTEEVWEPMELSLTPGGQMEVFWIDPSNPGTGSDTPEPQMVSQIITGVSPQDFWSQAGTDTNFFMPFTLNGQWDSTGFKCVPDPKDPHGSFQQICNVAPIPIGCLRRDGVGGPGGGPLPIGALQGPGVDLRARMQQRIHPGSIASWPAQPNPALVNVPTCFFLNGADIDGQDPNVPATFEVVLLGPADGEGRQVFYVFRIDVALQGVAWTFEPGPDGGQTDPPPGACQGVSNAPLQFAHTYHHYSPPGGFGITATETFTLHVTEYWYDSAEKPHPAADLGDLPPITVNPGPPGGFSKVVVQEEGVPVG